MSNAQEQNIDIAALINEVGQEVDALIKAEQTRLQDLKKNEESAKEASAKESMEKMEPQAEQMKKDGEGSGFESPAPEASDASAPAAPASADASQSQSAESLESMVQSLSEEELNELQQVVQMEMQARQASAAPAADASIAAPAADASAAAVPAPEMKMESAYKREMEDVRNQLKKSEETTGKLEQAVVSMTELMDKIVNRPVQKAITDIRTVDFVDKGEKDLKKSETVADASTGDIDAKFRKMSSDSKQLASLTKSERETLSSYFVGKQKTPEVLKLYSK